MSGNNRNDEDNDVEQGFWYWFVLTKPSNYFIAKAMGGDAEKQADAAMEALGPAFGALIVLSIIGLAIFGVGRLLNIW